MRKLIVVAGLMLLVTGRVEAQGCVPSNIPTNTISGFQILAPNQVPFAVVTLSSSATNTNNNSHKSQVGAQTLLNIYYYSNNTASVHMDWSLDNGSWQPTGFAIPNNTSSFFPMRMDPSWTGHVLNLRLVGMERPGSGSSSPSTQDDIHITVLNQPQGIYYYDGNDSNIYYAITMWYSGIPEVSFADCPAMRTAHHTPTATLQLQNVSSGEVRNAVSVTGATVLANNTVQASVVDYISALPGAKVTGTYGGVTFCDVDNINFFGIQNLFRIEGAVTVVADLGHPPVPGPERPVPSVIYDVAPICQNNCDPPDWQATKVHSWVGRQKYWVGECQLLRAPDLDGVPWTPLCEFMTDSSKAFGSGLIPTTVELATGGLALPYPGPAPDLPIPGKCTKLVGYDANGKPYYNVLFTVGPKDLANFFRNIFQ